MIGKGHSISRTRESIAYGWNQEKDAEVVLREHVAGETPIGQQANVFGNFTRREIGEYHVFDA